MTKSTAVSTRWLVASEAGFEARFQAFLAEKREADSALGRQVADIIARVRAEGGDQVQHLDPVFDGKRFDRAGLQLATAPGAAVGLCEDRERVIAVVDHCPQRRYGKIRRAGEGDPQG